MGLPSENLYENSYLAHFFFWDFSQDDYNKIEAKVEFLLSDRLVWILLTQF